MRPGRSARPSTDVEHTCGAAMTTVIGGKLKFLGDKPKKKKKRNREELDDDDDDLPLPTSVDPFAGDGKITTSGVVVMGHDGSNFAGQLAVGDSILVCVSDRFRNTQDDETRLVNMVLGKTSLNLEAPFSCDVTSPTSFMVLKKAPDMEALKAARAAERRRLKQLEEESSTVTYKVTKPGTGPWKTWTTVTEKVSTGTSREDMLRKRASEKHDRHCR